MKSIGEHLAGAREEKGFSFDQVVHDTNISREYIHALEEDDFDFFPAEAYLIGFLRNYSEYLGLDPSRMVGIYKNFIISEEPVPMDLLLGKKKTAPEKKEPIDEFDVSHKSMPRWIVPIIAVAVVCVVAGVLFLPSLLNQGKEVELKPEVSLEKTGEIPTSPKEFFLTEDTLDITVTTGDKINVSTGSRLVSFIVILTEVEKSLSYLDGENVKKKMDLEKDMEQVILIEGNNGVYFYIKDVSAEKVVLIAQKVSVDEKIESEISDKVAAESSTVEITPERIAEKIVIVSEAYPAAYELDVFFRGDGLFRYKADNKQVVERFYQAGERLEIDVNRFINLWISNAGIVDLKISGKEINAGGNGQVSVRSVKWIKNNETGKYELIILPFD